MAEEKQDSTRIREETEKFGLKGQSAYTFDQSVFPTDIGTTTGTNGKHFVMFNILVNDRSTWDTDTSGRKWFTRTNEIGTSDRIRFGSRLEGGGQPAGALTKKDLENMFNPNASGTDSISFWSDTSDQKAIPFWTDNGSNLTQYALGKVGEVVGKQLQSALGAAAFERGTHRIKESIVLFMPTNVEYHSVNEYTPLRLTGALTGGISAAASTLAGGGGALGTAAMAVGFAADTAEKGLALMGRPINPKIEVLFRETKQRTFTFTFKFAPESEEESTAMENIIEQFRFHAAPEFDAGSVGFTQTPPSEFDITWYHDGKENVRIPRITTCVLEKIDINFAPTGIWQTFRNGAPVSALMILNFQETEVITKKHVALGF